MDEAGIMILSRDKKDRYYIHIGCASLPTLQERSAP